MEKHEHNKKNKEEIPVPEHKNEKSPEETIEVFVSEFEELSKKAGLCSEYQDKLLRLRAEFDNARKRMQKERDELTRFASQELIMEILPVVDDFDRLMDGIKDIQANGAVLEGIKMIQKRIHEVLIKNGLVKMETVGEKFDPAKHEALLTVETDEYPEGTIIEEARSGYLLHDKILRHAVVTVATAKDTKEPGESTRTQEQKDSC
ncbi:MAG: nucleotide exchange factor GrpE [Candidatus Omnitrophica bacterium]|nr:nucleotide exchange factor GrpE [Candidatus Omnitrophota bacterium]